MHEASRFWAEDPSDDEAECQVAKSFAYSDSRRASAGSQALPGNFDLISHEAAIDEETQNFNNDRIQQTLPGKLFVLILHVYAKVSDEQTAVDTIDTIRHGY